MPAGIPGIDVYRAGAGRFGTNGCFIANAVLKAETTRREGKTLHWNLNKKCALSSIEKGRGGCIDISVAGKGLYSC
jgi:hypothetical protein